VPKQARSQRLLVGAAILSASGAIVAGSGLPAVAAGPPTGTQLSASCQNDSPTQWADWTTTPLQLAAGEDASQLCDLSFYNYTSTSLHNLTSTLTLTPQSVAATGFTAQQLAPRLLAQVGTAAQLNPVAAPWTVGSDGSLSLVVPDSINVAAESGEADVRFSLTGAPTKTSAVLKGVLAVTQPDGTSVGSPLDVSIDYRADGKSYTPGTPSTYVATAPARLADVASVGAGHVVSVRVAGVDGVPASGVTAVVLNVTAASAARSGFVTAYADGVPRPGVSTLDYAPGRAVADQATVPVVDGKVDLYTSAGPVRLIADLSGYYEAGNAGTRYTSTAPARLADVASVGAGHVVSVRVAGADGVPASGVTAVVLNVTAASAARTGFVTAYADSRPRPGVSSLDYAPGQAIANEVTVPVLDGKVDLYTSAGPVRLIADLSGYYSSQGDRFVPSGPTRIADSRIGLNFYKAPIDLDTLTPASWANGIPPQGVTAVDLNVTATDETGSGYVQVYPDSSTPPATSTLNYSRSDSIANHVQASTESYGQIAFQNNGPRTMALIVDLDGYFTG